MQDQACLGQNLLLDRPRDQHKILEQCDGCPARLRCFKIGIDNIYIDDTGHLHAWFVHGGRTPEELVELYQLSQQNIDLTCARCDSAVELVDWDIIRHRCVNC